MENKVTPRILTGPGGEKLVRTGEFRLVKEGEWFITPYKGLVSKAHRDGILSACHILKMATKEETMAQSPDSDVDPVHKKIIQALSDGHAKRAGREFPEKPPDDVASFSYAEWENRKLAWELTQAKPEEVEAAESGKRYCLCLYRDGRPDSPEFCTKCGGRIEPGAKVVRAVAEETQPEPRAKCSCGAGPEPLHKHEQDCSLFAAPSTAGEERGAQPTLRDEWLDEWEAACKAGQAYISDHNAASEQDIANGYFTEPLDEDTVRNLQEAQEPSTILLLIKEVRKLRAAASPHARDGVPGPKCFDCGSDLMSIHYAYGDRQQNYIACRKCGHTEVMTLAPSAEEMAGKVAAAVVLAFVTRQSMTQDEVKSLVLSVLKGGGQ